MKITFNANTNMHKCSLVLLGAKFIIIVYHCNPPASREMIIEMHFKTTRDFIAIYGIT